MDIYVSCIMHGGLPQHSAVLRSAQKHSEARSLQRLFLSIAIAILGAIVIMVALSASAFSLYMGYLELSRRANSALDTLSPEIARALDTPEKPAGPAALLDGLKIDPDVIGASIIDDAGPSRGQFRDQDVVRPTLATPGQEITWMRREVLARRKLAVRGKPADLAIAYTTTAAYRRAGRQLGIFLVSGFGSLALVSLILRALLMRQLRPWRALVESMIALVDRDYDHRVPGLDRPGEIGDMARALESFRTKLIDREALRRRTETAHQETKKLHARMDGRVDEFRKTIRQVLREVTGLSDQMTVSADGLKSIAAQTSLRADDASSAIRQTSANVAGVAEASEELAASIREIERQVEQTNGIVSDATKSTMESGEVIKSLYAKADEIGEIIDLIQKIAAQTDLLALNATIEAVRAGESGRGFAVVAQEVKSLANQTTHASKRVADHIRAIQEATSRAVEAISTIDTTMIEAEKFSAIISIAVEQQSIATAEISRNALAAARSADAAAGSMKCLSAAVGETDQSAAQVHHSASDVGAQAQTLSATVDAFLEDTASRRGVAL